MRFTYFFVSILIGFLAYVIYNIIDLTGLLLKVEEKNSSECEIIRGAKGIEDMVKYNNYLIGGSDDRGKLWEIPEYKNKKTEDGKIVIIDTSKDLTDLKIEPVEIQNFPHDKLAFHPHGIYLYKNKYLYVINHAYHKGGERVEVLEIINGEGNRPRFNYLRSIQFAEEFTGIFNDLVVIGDNDEILITSYLPFPDSISEGRSSSPLNILKNFLPTLLRIPLTYIYHCKGNNCTRVPKSESLMNNGITIDTNHNKLYAVNVFEKKIKVYKIETSQSENIINFIYEIPVGYWMDNVEFDKETGIISAGVFGRTIDHVNLSEYLKHHKKVGGSGHWGSLQIDTKNNDKVDLLVMQSKFYGISGSYKIGDKVFHGSWVDDGVLVCKV